MVYFISICIGVLIITYLILLTIDKNRYNKKLDSCGNYIPFNMIPTPTKIIHYCKDFENIRYNAGDIFVVSDYEYNEFKMKADLVYKYYIALESGNIVELSKDKINRIEIIYNMKIRDGY